MLPLAAPRLLLSRSSSSSSSSGLSSALPYLRPLLRHASSKTPPNPIPLAQPTKFVPPSHGARLPKAQRYLPRQYPGPPLSSATLAAQRTKKYPNMMPPAGTFMHWFLTTRAVHLWISLGTLFGLGVYTFFLEFRRTSPFYEMLPTRREMLGSPLEAGRRVVEVARLHVARQSAETAERRKRKVDDVVKRGAYRKAHGGEEEGLGGWTAKGEEGKVEGGGRRVKKWFGIW
ncbi:MAG: hypothetical protein M1829_006673 [Trizodia sp. TS-e1964]|nr:MAG: hypothetical protein M1829_006673 [Trizodia sp. TS-e1964]